MRRVKGLQLLTGRQASLSADQEWSNNAIDENIFTLINCILVYFQMNFQGFVYFCNEIGVNVSNFSRNAISIVVFQLNLYNHFSPKRDILFNGIRYLFQKINFFHTSCFYYMEIKGNYLRCKRNAGVRTWNMVTTMNMFLISLHEHVWVL